jgi:hypothetical protein
LTGLGLQKIRKSRSMWRKTSRLLHFSLHHPLDQDRIGLMHLTGIRLSQDFGSVGWPFIGRYVKQDLYELHTEGRIAYSPVME